MEIRVKYKVKLKYSALLNDYCLVIKINYKLPNERFGTNVDCTIRRYWNKSEEFNERLKSMLSNKNNIIEEIKKSIDKDLGGKIINNKKYAKTKELYDLIDKVNKDNYFIYEYNK